jgi:indoleacetamide hydrolase
VSINGGEPIDEMATFLRDTDPTSVAGIPGLSLPAGIMQEGLPVRIELDGLTGTDRCLLAMGVAFEQVLSSLPAPML